VADTTVVIGWQLIVAIVALTALAAVTSVVGRLNTGVTTVVASLRAVVQLAAVSAVILAAVSAWWSTILFVLVMFGVATWTSAHRMTRDRSGLYVALAILAGITPVLTVIIALGAVPLTGISLVPIGGIVIGGTMTACSLAGRRALDQLITRRGEYEAALSLGFLERDAALELVRPAAGDALVPALDQTRTVGLVTLPGAFVGVLLGGGSPLEAGAAQVLVLVGLLASETIAALVTVELVGRGRIRRDATATGRALLGRRQ
jgi:putative ABC transport system permease protein